MRFESDEWSQGYQTVGQFMATDLFTVRPDDLVDLAASVMTWRHIRHVPVEDDEGQLVGLVSHRALLKLLTQGALANQATVSVREIMRRNRVGCFPYLMNG